MIYFTSAIILAYTLKDNRAFCKYLCPITAILKITSRFSFNCKAYFFAKMCMTRVCLPKTSPTFLRIRLRTESNFSASSNEEIFGNETTPFLITSITCFLPRTTIMARCLSISSILRLSFSRTFPIFIKSLIRGSVLFLKLFISVKV
ncbi:MAG: 4Fe-4S binding protein [Nitrosopumilus sp.]